MKTKPMLRMSTASVAIMAALGSGGALAQTSDGDPANAEVDELALEEVIVTAMRSKKGRNAIPNTITLIGQEELSDQIAIAPDLSSVLEKLVPGYSPSRQKISSGGESFRGRKPLVLIDGVPQSNPLRDGARSGFTIDPEVVERVEVVHGSNAIQGFGATGGIINYVTKSADKSGDLVQTISAKVTSSDEFASDGFGYRGYYSASQKLDKFDFLVSAAYQHRGVGYDGRGNSIGIDVVQGDTSDSNSYNFFGKFGYDISDTQRLQLMVNRFQIKQTDEYIPTGGSRELDEPTTAIKGTYEGDEPVNDVWTASLAYTNDDVAGGSLSIVGAFQDFSAVYGGGNFGSFQDPTIAPIGELFDQSAIVSRKYSLRTTYNKDDLFDSGIGLITGIDFLHDNTAQELVQTGRNRVPVIKFNNITPFVQLEKTFFDKLTLSGGLRLEYAKLKVPSYNSVAGATRLLPQDDPRWYTETPVDGGTPSFTEPIYNVGAIFNLTDRVNVFGNRSQGFTMADVGRALRDISVLGVDVDDYISIDPVVVDTTELGITYNGPKLHFQASYFWSVSKLGQRLAANFDAEGSLRVQRQRVEIDGLDVSLDYDTGDVFSFGGNLSILNGKSDSDGDEVVDLKLDGLNISPPKGTLYAAANLSDSLYARLQMTSFFDKEYDDENTLADFEGYTLFDLSMNYKTDAGTFTLAVENLLDKYYLSLFSQTFAPDSRQYAGRGRTITLGYTVQF